MVAHASRLASPSVSSSLAQKPGGDLIQDVTQDFQHATQVINELFGLATRAVSANVSAIQAPPVGHVDPKDLAKDLIHTLSDMKQDLDAIANAPPVLNSKAAFVSNPGTVDDIASLTEVVQNLIQALGHQEFDHLPVIPRTMGGVDGPLGHILADIHQFEVGFIGIFEQARPEF
jgi:hypothetical protein